MVSWPAVRASISPARKKALNCSYFDMNSRHRDIVSNAPALLGMPRGVRARESQGKQGQGTRKRGAQTFEPNSTETKTVQTDAGVNSFGFC